MPDISEGEVENRAAGGRRRARVVDERARTTILPPLPARVLHRRMREPRYANSPHLS